MIAVSHPTGNEFVRALLMELEKRKLLTRFFTTISAPGEAVLQRLPEALRAQMARRTYDIPRGRITTRPAREMIRLLANTTGAGFLAAHGRGFASVDAVYRDLDVSVARWLRSHRKDLPRVVHCYEDGAEETFRAAREAGVTCVYELPIAYWQTMHRILHEEAARRPEWEPTLRATSDPAVKLERKTRELELADVVVCPGGFVLDSLPEDIRSSKKCVVAKFGSPVPSFEIRNETVPRKKLRVLFAGTMTQRKGLADLFDAMKLLRRNDVELVVMGSPVLSMSFYRKQFPDFIYEPPRPHDAVMELMQTCDVLALPSLVEGRALVQQEALACGLPLIVTANAGAADLVDEGITGFLVPVRDAGAIAEKIEWFAANRALLQRMRDETREKAAQYKWKDYCNTIIEATASGGTAL